MKHAMMLLLQPVIIPERYIYTGTKNILNIFNHNNYVISQENFRSFPSLVSTSCISVIGVIGVIEGHAKGH